MSEENLVLIDTSAWIEALRKDGDPEVRRKVNELMVSGRAAWTEMVLLELWNGARGKAEKTMLKKLSEDIEMLSIGPEVWELAYENAQACRNSGKTIPATDILITACAQNYEVGTEHCDAHFDVVSKVLSGAE